MEISTFTIRILFLFFPGILSAYVIDKLTVHRERKIPFFLLNVFLLGIFSYALYFLILPIFKTNHETNVFKVLTNTDIIITNWDLFFLSLIGILIGLAVSWFSKNKLFFKIAQCLSISKKISDLDIWGYLFNLEDLTWIFVRDHKNGLLYRRCLDAFSDDSKNAELLLTRVSVYKENDDSHLYDLRMIYLSRNREDITIEITSPPYTSS